MRYWDRWVRRAIEARLICWSGADLSGANLSGADLSGADLSGANLSGADLSGADLSGADLRGANLSWANLSKADLSGADLIKANLRKANLHWANLSGADLSGADLRGADLRGANLRSADLSKADLSKADLRGANLRGADLSGADLSGANLSGANLSEVAGLATAAKWLAKFQREPNGSLVVYKAIGCTDYPPPEHWRIEPGGVLTEICNPDRCTACGCGVNFGTLEWVRLNYSTSTIWECRIDVEDQADIVVPYHTGGNARCARLTLVRVV